MKHAPQSSRQSYSNIEHYVIQNEKYVMASQKFFADNNLALISSTQNESSSESQENKGTQINLLTQADGHPPVDEIIDTLSARTQDTKPCYPAAANNESSANT